MVKKADEILAKKPNIELMTIRELTLICKPLKIKSDGKMPVKKQELIEAYMVWKNRPPPVFEEDISSSNDDVVAPILEEGATTTDNDNDIDDEDGKNNETNIQIAEV